MNFTNNLLKKTGSTLSTSTTFHELRQLGYSSTQIYKLVSDTSSYPQFVPFITSSKQLSSTLIGSTTKQKCELAVGFGGKSLSFISNVEAVDQKSVKAMAEHSLLFKSLKTDWIFKELPKGKSCIVDFSVE